MIGLLVGVFFAIFLREMVFKGKELGEEEDKERNSVCEICQMISFPFEGFGELSVIQQTVEKHFSPGILPWDIPELFLITFIF